MKEMDGVNINRIANIYIKKKLNGYCLKKDKYNFSHIIEKQSSIANNKLI